MICPKCGNDIVDNSEFCPKCGQKTKDNKKTIIIICSLVVIILTGISVLLLLDNKNSTSPSDDGNKESLTEKDNKEKKEETKKEEEKEERDFSKILDVSNLDIKYENELANSIKIEKAIYEEKYSKLLLLGTNNNTIPVYYTIDLNYLNDKGERIDRVLDFGYVNAGQKFVSEIYNKTYDDFANFNISISSNKIKSYQTIHEIKDGDISIHEESNEIRVTYNNLDEEKSVYMGIIYYENNEISYFDEGFISINNDGTVSSNAMNFYPHSNINCPYSIKDYKECFDRYEIFVSAVITTNTDY